MDDYSCNGSAIFEDDKTALDTSYRINDFFDIAQKQVAALKKIIVCAVIDPASAEKREKIQSVPLPERFYQLICCPYEISAAGGELRFSAKISAPFEIEYAKMPENLDYETPDDYEFEVSEDAAAAMPFFVAAQLLMGEDDAAYSRLMNEYQTALINLDLRAPVLQGRIKNKLFGNRRKRFV